MLEALLDAVSDPDQLAELAKATKRLKIPQPREALQSHLTIKQRGVMVAHIDTPDAAIENQPADRAALGPAPPDRRAVLAAIWPIGHRLARSRQGDTNASVIDLLAEHPGSTGGDLAKAKGLHLNPESVSTHLNQLAKAGDIDKTSRG
jgi:hypothetical protein